ncbi:hypothetical protein NDN08_007605 [Rhodosorus marinus]|uniref:Uncharacterized protein n=1 Tax=Rhodosorus marinus TaxID=101924 RepID=A0AAV8UZK2_9RHOD|nr:hypothetical protein NDN08_007605 [Rhodosorus marinus]
MTGETDLNETTTDTEIPMEAENVQPSGPRALPTSPDEVPAAADPAAVFLQQLRACDQFCQAVGIAEGDTAEFYKATFKLYSRLGSTKDLKGVTSHLYQLADSPHLW